MTPIIEAHGLSKSLGRVRALDNLELVAQPGRIRALLGPNGAGKTTFVSAVATLLRPDSGELRVAGFDTATEPRRVRQVIGLAGQHAAVEPAMTGGYALTWVFITLGLVARNAQAAQSMAFLLVMPLTFVSSAYVPSHSLPGWMQPVADHQPISPLVNAIRSLMLGGTDAAGLGHTTTYWVAVSLGWWAAITAVFGGLAVSRFARTR